MLFLICLTMLGRVSQPGSGSPSQLIIRIGTIPSRLFKCCSYEPYHDHKVHGFKTSVGSVNGMIPACHAGDLGSILLVIQLENLIQASIA